MDHPDPAGVRRVDHVHKGRTTGGEAGSGHGSLRQGSGSRRDSSQWLLVPPGKEGGERRGVGWVVRMQ